MLWRLPPYSGISESTRTTRAPGLHQLARERRADEPEPARDQNALALERARQLGRGHLLSLEVTDRSHVAAKPSRGRRCGTSSATERAVGELASPRGRGREGVASARTMHLLRLRVAFVLGIFPCVSETFVIDQIAQLVDRGVEVDDLSLSRGDEANVSRAYFDYDDGVEGRVPRLPAALATACSRARGVGHSGSLVVILASSSGDQCLQHGRWALSLKFCTGRSRLPGRSYDVVHCHFGTSHTTS